MFEGIAALVNGEADLRAEGGDKLNSLSHSTEMSDEESNQTEHTVCVRGITIITSHRGRHIRGAVRGFYVKHGWVFLFSVKCDCKKLKSVNYMNDMLAVIREM